ncbi:glycoside hydrolase family 3 C-terminal domain-containing protein [Bifidobacterium felsineum]|uniref:Glycosyl hydrolase family 3 n=1 Tax=Bifidobacterium felsineum TaxID=2045440 RepID=A0A2M9HL56_9BIFI|nr:glycoside hydrolase family 3 C-terminal domain-containing protein [Bifidobacterium felsineum]MBT1163017.1 glycoside hydrolase family 3 C-terminal domain-containing protein [Bifidobacterium felsineum]PJM77533.1 glycosyl hydrolase family 3 [Bifidobacterium felsineum]
MASQKPAKLKMSNRTFRRIWIPIVTLLTVIAVALSVAGNMFSSVLDSYLGGGTLQVNRAEGTDSWDATYNAKETGSLAEAKAASDKVSEQVADEGIVLLKNNGVLPLAEKSTITPFGYGYLNPVYSGTGAAATTDKDMVTIKQGLAAHFKINATAAKAMKNAEATAPDAAEGTPALDADKNSLQAIMDKGESARIYEYDPSIYQSITDTDGTTGIVFIRRNGSEGIDKRTYAYDDGTPHYLALTTNEKNTIRAAKEHCGKVVVVLNAANPMEVSPLMSGDLEADAIVWMGTAGSRGFASLGKILSGAVNPSGRLTDIYATDFTKDPTYANFGDYRYTNAKFEDNQLLGDVIPGAGFGTIDRPYVEYEEGVYVGYRYYETADVEDPQFMYGELDGKGGVATAGSVAYPFGYGLSYTTFEQRLDSVKEQNGDIEAQVTVTNTGQNAGKDVVQLYYTAPYTDYDRVNKVEKSATVLGAFDKTDELQPGESATLKLRFHVDDMASYDYHHANDNGTTGAYVLEAGNYAIELKNNSHDVIDSRTVTVDKTQWFTDDNPTTADKKAQSVMQDDGTITDEPESGKYVAASNEFATMNTYMDDASVTQLSRSDWVGTFPTAPKERKGEAPQVALDEFEWWNSYDPQTDSKLGNVEGSEVYAAEQPTSNADNGLSLIDLRGLAYNDPKWDQLLDQIDWAGDKSDIQSLLYMAAYQTKDVLSIGKPSTVDKDGAMGWSIDGASSWAGANVMAATWNVDLLRQVGECLGEEALQAGLNGWYAPAVNTHRSPFSGRVYEYYSEDGLLAGKLAAAAIGGIGDKGVFSYLKHFALNDQESYRSEGLATWANEQAVRELYLKPFQIATQEARSTEKYLDSHGKMQTKTVRSATAMMSAQNFIGGVMGFAHRGLLTNVLRGEWNFHGAVVTDLFMSKSKTERDMIIRAGTDMYMIQAPGYYASDYDSATARTVMRNAIHNIAYMTANSNAMNGITPGSTLRITMSPWKKALIAIDVAIALIVALLITRMVLRARDEKKRPELYRKPKRRKRKSAVGMSAAE